jgi:hypothetical protein
VRFSLNPTDVVKRLKSLGYVARQNQQNESLFLNLGGPESEANKEHFMGVVLLNPVWSQIIGACPRTILDFRQQVMHRKGNLWERHNNIPGPSELNRVEVRIVDSGVVCEKKGGDPIWIESRAEQLDYGLDGYKWEEIQHFLDTLKTFCTQAYPSPTLEATDLAIPPDRVHFWTSRIIRDTELAWRVKVIHSFKCQICRYSIELQDGKYYAESHHLKPLGNPHTGPDIIGNIVCLCPNHHAALDYLAFAISLPMFHQLAAHVIDHSYIDYHNHMFEQARKTSD